MEDCSFTQDKYYTLHRSPVFIMNTLYNEGFMKLYGGKWKHQDSGKEFETLMDAYEYYLFEL